MTMWWILAVSLVVGWGLIVGGLYATYGPDDVDAAPEDRS